jgi:hypothetical protein
MIKLLQVSTAFFEEHIMIWPFGALTIIQIVLWVYFITKKKYAVLITTGLIGIFSIWSYVDAYLKYIYFNPCEGIERCMNETGMIFVVLFIIMLISILISLLVFIADCYNFKKKQAN